MEHTLAAAFDNRDNAERAKQALLQDGFAASDIEVTAGDLPGSTSGTSSTSTSTSAGSKTESTTDRIANFFSELFGSNHSDRHLYTEAVSRGHYVLTLQCDDDDEIDSAIATIERFGPIDIDEHAEQWRAAGWSGVSGTSATTATQTSRVGATGGSLQSGQGSAMGATSGSQQRAEVASTNQDSLFSGNVNPSQTDNRSVVGGVRVYPRGDDTTGQTEDTAYRNHWQANYASQGGRYEDYAPAYSYGSSMRNDQRYSQRQWGEVEPELQRDWESRYPGSAWEKFKAAVQHGWDRVTH